LSRKRAKGKNCRVEHCFHSAATVACHWAVASALKTRSADRERGCGCLRPFEPAGLPLPPMLVNVLSVPASVGTRTSATEALRVNFWQSRQWHTVSQYQDISGWLASHR
jgi:hypothetical protein